MDNEFPHLAKAPIREAVLDIMVEPRLGLGAEGLAVFVEKVQAEFPDAQPIRSMQAQVDVSGDHPGVWSGPAQMLGTICWNESKTRAVQARVNGFSVSHIQSYESWEVLREQAHRLWTEYNAVAAPTKVIRCALRYINQFELPVSVDMSAMLLTRPEVAPELPQMVDDFFMRVVVPFPGGRKASIAQAIEPITDSRPDVRGFILDIDAFSLTPFDIDDVGMWNEFDALRVLKNKCFFRSLGPAMLEIFR